MTSETTENIYLVDKSGDHAIFKCEWCQQPARGKALGYTGLLQLNLNSCGADGHGTEFKEYPRRVPVTE